MLATSEHSQIMRGILGPTWRRDASILFGSASGALLQCKAERVEADPYRTRALSEVLVNQEMSMCGRPLPFFDFGSGA